MRGLAGVSGGSLPAAIWHNFMDQATRDRPNAPFVVPADLGGQVLNSTTTPRRPPSPPPPSPQPRPASRSRAPPSPVRPCRHADLAGRGRAGARPVRPSLGRPGDAGRDRGGQHPAGRAGPAGRRRGPSRGPAPAGRRRPAGAGLWLLTRAVLLVVSLNPRLYSAALFGDVRFYGAKVERMFQGELPYRDVATEYPPGGVPFTILPALVVGTGAGYRLAFACEMLLVDAVGLWAATRLARVVDAGRRASPWPTCWPWWPWGRCWCSASTSSRRCACCWPRPWRPRAASAGRRPPSATAPRPRSSPACWPRCWSWGWCRRSAGGGRSGRCRCSWPASA